MHTCTKSFNHDWIYSLPNTSVHYLRLVISIENYVDNAGNKNGTVDVLFCIVTYYCPTDVHNI